tara:strand:- start:579 stop:749 length:171 start_codon:yes stop_codon:yes gene_type:complete
MKKYMIAVLLLLASLFFVVDPFKLWPIDHLIGKGRVPCTLEDTRPTCTGKLNIFGL